MLITSTIPNLVNGVSQQPDSLRLASQAEEQVNFLSSVTDGLVMRPPTRHLAKVDAARWDNAFLHTINRDTAERYLVVIRNNTVRVFEAETGVERTVTAPDGFGYLTGGTKDTYRAVTVADFTFILNQTRTVTMAANLSTVRPNQWLVQVRAGNYAKGYRIIIDNVLVANFDTPDGSSPSHGYAIDTGNLAQELLNDLNASGLPAAGWSFWRFGEIIVINSPTGGNSIRTEDGAGGTNMRVIGATVQRFSDLPSGSPNGFRVEVVGDQASNFDNYHLLYQASGASGLNSGVWKETLKGGEQFRLNASTMPHVLVRESDGTFTFRQATWADRLVGDADKIPPPSFVGRQIRDIFFYRNRLGFASDENIIMSEAGEFFNFWRKTAITVTDSDPIDIAVSNNKVSLINHAVPFNESLLLFSDQSQFILDGGQLLTPDSVSVNQTTEFESLPRVKPVGVGRNIYFAVPRGSFTGVREYFVEDGVASANASIDVTSHCPQYLPSGVFKLAATSSEDTLLLLSDQSPRTIWVYRFFFGDGGKLQSAWSRWNFSTEDTILNADFLESRVYLVVARSDGTYLEVIDLEGGAVDQGSTMLYRADRGFYADTRLSNTRTFDGTHTTFTLPYATNEPLWVIARAGATGFPEGYVLPITRPSATTVRAEGDWRNEKVFIGQQYEARYEFSTFFMRGSEPGGGVSANLDGRLQVRYLAVDYVDAGFFRLRSTPRNRDTSVKTFSGRVLGLDGGNVGELNLSTGRIRIPVMCRNTDAQVEIQSDSFLPCSFTSAEWEGTFVSRARKV